MSGLLSKEMKKYKVEIFKNSQNKKNPKMIDKAIRIKATNDKPMKLNEVYKYFDYLVNHHKIDRYKISIIGKYDNGFITLKSFDEGNITEFDEDYFVNKPNRKYIEKALNNFYYVDFSFR